MTSNKEQQSHARLDCQLVGWHHSLAKCLRHSHQPPRGHYSVTFFRKTADFCIWKPQERVKNLWVKATKAKCLLYRMMTCVASVCRGCLTVLLLHICRVPMSHMCSHFHHARLDHATSPRHGYVMENIFSLHFPLSHFGRGYFKHL